MPCIAFRSRLGLAPHDIRREASSLHSLSTASAISSYPKPFKRMLRILLAFLMLASLLMHIRFAHYGLSIVFVSKQASTKSSTHPIHFVACFRHRFALKKPLTFVRGFVSRSRAGSNRCRSFCRALPNHSATGPCWKAKITQRT